MSNRLPFIIASQQTGTAPSPPDPGPGLPPPGGGGPGQGPGGGGFPSSAQLSRGTDENTTSVTLDLPSGISNGDYLIVAIQSTKIMSAPAPLIAAFTVGNFPWYFQVVGCTYGGQTFTYTWASAVDVSYLCYSAPQADGGATPWQAQSSAFVADSAPTAPAVNSDVAGRKIGRFYTQYANFFYNPDSPHVFSVGRPDGALIAMTMDNNLSVAGANPAMQISSNGGSFWVAGSLTLRT